MIDIISFLKKKNLTIFLATLNLTMILFGYQLIASVFMPIISQTGDSQAITIPYRAFSLGLSLYLIFFGGDRPKLNKTITLLIVFWIILILRLYYDLNFRPLFRIEESDVKKVTLYMFGIVLPSSIAFYRSYTKVNFRLAFKMSILFLSIIVFMNFMFNDSLFINNLNDRVSGGIALNTISFGHCGASLALLGFYMLLYRKNKLFPILFILIGCFILLRSASRGPLFAFVGTVIFIFGSKTKKVSLMIVCFVILSLLSIIFQDLILAWISKISPEMTDRLNVLIVGHDSTGRNSQYMQAIQIWSESPLIGKYFTLYTNTGIRHSIYYSHNIIFDAAIQGGIVGVAIMIYFYVKIFKTSFQWIANDYAYAWLGVILIQRFLGLLTSGAFFYESVATVGMLAVALLSQKKIQKEGNI